MDRNTNFARPFNVSKPYKTRYVVAQDTTKAMADALNASQRQYSSERGLTEGGPSGGPPSHIRQHTSERFAAPRSPETASIADQADVDSHWEAPEKDKRRLGWVPAEAPVIDRSQDFFDLDTSEIEPDDEDQYSLSDSTKLNHSSSTSPCLMPSLESMRPLTWKQSAVASSSASLGATQPGLRVLHKTQAFAQPHSFTGATSAEGLGILRFGQADIEPFPRLSHSTPHQAWSDVPAQHSERNRAGPRDQLRSQRATSESDAATVHRISVDGLFGSQPELAHRDSQRRREVLDSVQESQRFQDLQGMHYDHKRRLSGFAACVSPEGELARHCLVRQLGRSTSITPRMISIEAANGTAKLHTTQSELSDSLGSAGSIFSPHSKGPSYEGRVRSMSVPAAPRLPAASTFEKHDASPRQSSAGLVWYCTEDDSHTTLQTPALQNNGTFRSVKASRVSPYGHPAFASSRGPQPCLPQPISSPIATTRDLHVPPRSSSDAPLAKTSLVIPVRLRNGPNNSRMTRIVVPASLDQSVSMGRDVEKATSTKESRAPPLHELDDAFFFQTLRRAYHDELLGASRSARLWRRVFSLRTLKHIVPFDPNSGIRLDNPTIRAESGIALDPTPSTETLLRYFHNPALGHASRTWHLWVRAADEVGEPLGGQARTGEKAGMAPAADMPQDARSNVSGHRSDTHTLPFGLDLVWGWSMRRCVASAGLFLTVAIAATVLYVLLGPLPAQVVGAGETSSGVVTLPTPGAEARVEGGVLIGLFVMLGGCVWMGVWAFMSWMLM